MLSVLIHHVRQIYQVQTFEKFLHANRQQKFLFEKKINRNILLQDLIDYQLYQEIFEPIKIDLI